MDRSPPVNVQLGTLADELDARRDAIMQAWRKAVDRDPDMTTGASLPRSQLNDHLPELLDAYGKKLRAAHRDDAHASTSQALDEAAAHGLQRWQQGYDLREVTREWGRLQLCVLDVLERYAADHADLDPATMATARRLWAETCADGVSESTVKYFHLQQVEAVGHVRDLDKALNQLKTLEQQRAELWRQAAHDLRGNVGVVANATAVISKQGLPQDLRDNFIGVLNRNVTSLRSLLEDVTNLARLQAGQEQRQVKPFDAAAVLHGLCDRMRHLGEESSLYLKAEGPDTLLVEGDSIKVQRIAQNLLLNAIKYTPQGGITVSWGDSRQGDKNRWMMCVQDTGPGFHAGPGAPMAGALEEATEESRQVEAHAKGHETDAERSGSAQSSPGEDDSRAVHQERGEGIGLSIVKRLCELLDATVEMDSVPGEGTTIRILFPRSYGATDFAQ